MSTGNAALPCLPWRHAERLLARMRPDATSFSLAAALSRGPSRLECMAEASRRALEHLWGAFGATELLTSAGIGAKKGARRVDSKALRFGGDEPIPEIKPGALHLLHVARRLLSDTDEVFYSAADDLRSAGDEALERQDGWLWRCFLVLGGLEGCDAAVYRADLKASTAFAAFRRVSSS